MQGTDGSFYGTTSKGGTSNNCQGGCGTVFKIGVALTPFVETQPSVGGAGTHVNILGSSLSGATGVTFNGASATFSVVSASQITATVPAGATYLANQIVSSLSQFWNLSIPAISQVNPAVEILTNGIPTPVPGLGILWNSNNALYWVTTTHTNYISGP